MESLAITNITELRAEIERLSLLEGEQRLALKARVNSPSAVFATVKSLFPANSGPPVDLLSLVSRFAIPLTLNKTLFRHSGFLVRMLVGLVSQKAAGYVTTGGAENLFEKAKSTLEGWLAHFKKPSNLSTRIHKN